MAKIAYVCNACKKATSRTILYRFAGVCGRCHKHHKYPQGA